MNDFYSISTSAVSEYMYPKKSVILNVKPGKSEVCPPTTEAEAVVVTMSEEPITEETVTVDPYDLKKAELIAYVKELHGDDADVDGTKAEILKRYF